MSGEGEKKFMKLMEGSQGKVEDIKEDEEMFE